MKFHKDLIGQQYIPGAVWLVLGLLLIILWGNDQILYPIRKNSWRPVQADLTEVRIVEPGKSRKNTAGTKCILHWKYNTADGKQHFGKGTIPGTGPASTPFSVGRSIRVLVNPEKPSESALYCWNDLTVSARIVRGTLWLTGLVLAGVGIFIFVRTPRKKAILVYDCRKETRSLLHYTVFPLVCLLFFGFLGALTLLFEERLFLLGCLSIPVFPFLMVRFMRRKTPLLFLATCPNPDCYSLKFTRMRMKALTENACPACGTPLGIPSRSPEKKWARSEIPESRLFPQTDTLPLYLFLCWILLLVPLTYFLYPPEATRSAAARNAGMAFLFGWMMTGMFLMPFFMEISRQWKLRKKKALVCPVCGACLLERGSIETLRQTGHCPACGADVVEESD